MRVPARLLALPLLAGAIAAPAAAQPNLVSNPGFETGTLAGYTLGGNAVAGGVAATGTSVAGVHPIFGAAQTVARSGAFGVYAVTCQSNTSSGGGFDTCPDGPEVLTLSQTLAVTPGTWYYAGLYIGARLPGRGFGEGTGFGVTVDDRYFQIYADGVGLLRPVGLGVVGDGTFRQVTGSFFAGDRSSVTVTWALSGSGTARTLLSADDFFVQVAPEPGTWALLAGGLAALALAARRRRA